MKKALSLIIALIMIAFTAFTVFAETEATYTITLDTYKEKYRIGDDVFVNAKLENLVSENGFIAFEIVIEYDPELLKALKGNNDEIAETNLPESWQENGERHENIQTDAEGNQTGKIKLVYTAPQDENGIFTPSITSSEYYVIVKFECIKEGKATVSVNAENGENCATGYDPEGSIRNYSGKGSKVTFEITGAGSNTEESEPGTDETKDHALYYIIVGAAIAICAAVLVITKIAKKK